MLHKIDFYIIKKFLGTFFYAIALIISISIVFDVSENIDDFMSKDVPLKAIAFDYYLNFIPYYINLYSFLFTFISVIFFTSRMAANSEMIAILSTGVSYKRLLLPYMATASVIAIISLILSNFIIPPTTINRLEFENRYFKKASTGYVRNIHRQINPTTFIYLESYNKSVDIAYKFSLERFEDGTLKEKLISNYMRWDTAQKKWAIKDYYIRIIDGLTEKIEKGASKDTTLPVTPIDFKQKENIVETMNYFELNQFIEKEKLRGNDKLESFLVEKHRRLAFPFSTLVLTLIGASIALHKHRGGTGMHLGLGLLLAAAYIFFMQVFSQYSINSNMNPEIAVWIPNLIFGIIAVGLFKNAQK